MFGLLTILFSFLLISVNPKSSYESARNAEKTTEIAIIWNALNRWEVGSQDNKLENLLANGNKTKIPKCADPLSSSSSYALHITGGLTSESLNTEIDFSFLVDEGLLAELPKSPNYSPGLVKNQTGYFICKSKTNNDAYVIFTQGEPPNEWIKIER